VGDGDNICPGCNPGPFLIEYDADCNNDGIVDYGQILAGDLPDANHNNIPDCCEQGTPCFLTQGLVAHWTLDGTPNDSSGNGHHGLAFNLDPTTDRFGVANAAYHFNGINGYMTAAGVPIPTNNAFSWSLWIKAEEPGVRGPIIERAQAFGVNLTSPVLFTEPGAALSFGTCCAGNGSSLQTPSGSLPANQWIHFVGTSAQDGRRALYLNGQRVAEMTGTAYGQALELFIFGRDRMDDPVIDNIYFPAPSTTSASTTANSPRRKCSRCITGRSLTPARRAPPFRRSTRRFKLRSTLRLHRPRGRSTCLPAPTTSPSA
jgi:hypothetical protein